MDLSKLFGESVRCPQCRAPAIIEWARYLLDEATIVPHVKIRCLDSHWFAGPADRLGVNISQIPSDD